MPLIRIQRLLRGLCVAVASAFAASAVLQAQAGPGTLWTGEQSKPGTVRAGQSGARPLATRQPTRIPTGSFLGLPGRGTQARPGAVSGPAAAQAGTAQPAPAAQGVVGVAIGQGDAWEMFRLQMGQTVASAGPSQPPAATPRGTVSIGDETFRLCNMRVTYRQSPGPQLQALGTGPGSSIQSFTAELCDPDPLKGSAVVLGSMTGTVDAKPLGQDKLVPYLWGNAELRSKGSFRLLAPAPNPTAPAAPGAAASPSQPRERYAVPSQRWGPLTPAGGR